jgi:hypothetical protein
LKKKLYEEEIERNKRLAEYQKQLRDATENNEKAQIALLESQSKSSIKLRRQTAERALAEAKFQKDAITAINEQLKKLGILGDVLKANEAELLEADTKLLTAQAELNKVNQEGSEKAKQAAEKAKQAAQDARNLRRQIQDEQIKGIDDLNQREQTQLIVSAQRRIEDLSLTAKDKKKNAKLILEIQNNLNKDLDKVRRSILCNAT